MRRFTLAMLTVLAAWFVPSVACAAPAVNLSAEQIAFYYNQFIIQGDGNVRVTLPDGTLITGKTFSMDLRLNRFLVAGDVTVKNASGEVQGAALSDFLDFKRIYFVPVISEPDRWTYLNNDFSTPLKGREMPGDAFFFPEIHDARPFLYAKTARIEPLTNVAFRGTRILAVVGYVPAPSYFLNFSSNPNLGQNSLSGASFDAPYPFAGSDHSLSTIHARYDPTNKAYLAFEQHLVADHSYAIFSGNALTRPQKQFNLLLSDQLTPRLQWQSLFQLNSFQHGLTQPLSVSSYMNAQVTYGFRRSFLQLTTNQYNQSLLAQPAGCLGSPIPPSTIPGSSAFPPGCFYGDPSHNWDPNHPFDAQLTWNGPDQRIGRSPVISRFRVGAGYAHNVFGEQLLGNTLYPTLWTHQAGVTLYTDAIKLGGATFFNAVVNGQKQWFSSPHGVGVLSATASLSHLIGTKFAAFLSYGATQINDRYNKESDQLSAYPPSQLPQLVLDRFGHPYIALHPSYLAFRGFGTYRTLVGQAAYTPNPDLAFILTMRESHDFPIPIPNLVGQPPHQVTGEIRVRVAPHVLLDVLRSYYFNFGDQRWSPQFGILIGP